MAAAPGGTPASPSSSCWSPCSSLFCSLAAYPLARMQFAGLGLVLALVVATILIPFQVVMIPLYLLMVQLGLRTTLLALVIP